MNYEYKSLTTNKTYIINIDQYTEKLIKGMNKKYIEKSVNENIELIIEGNCGRSGIICGNFVVLSTYHKPTESWEFSIILYKLRGGIDINKNNSRYTKYLKNTLKSKISIINPIEYFGYMTQRKLKIMFSYMIAAYNWNDVSDMIASQSLYGLAYYNAVRRVFDYKKYDINSGENVSEPSNEIINEEFKKILIKKIYAGKEIDPDIKERYLN